MVLQEEQQAFGDGGLNLVPHLRVSKLCLGLAFKLWIGKLDADYGGQTLPRVFTGQVGLVLLQQLLLLSIVVQNAGDSGSEAGEVCSAVYGVDAVGEGIHELSEAVVVL